MNGDGNDVAQTGGMRPYPLLLATVVLLSATLVNPAESAQRQRRPDGNGGGQERSGGQAGPRGAQPRGDTGGARNGGGGERRESPPPAARESAPPPQTRSEAVRPQSRGEQRGRADGQRGNDDRGGRADAQRGNDDRGRARNGNSRVAIPRQGPPPQRRDGRYDGRDGRYDGRNVYVYPRGRNYNYNSRYNLRPYYYRPFAYGYGPAGRGFLYYDLYYDSYIWHPRNIYRNGTYGSYGYPTGELRIDLPQRDAQVYIDGYYAGRVDEFDGVFQALRLEEGDYQVEVIEPGYEPLDFDVRILPGEKVTYRGELLPERP